MVVLGAVKPLDSLGEQKEDNKATELDFTSFATQSHPMPRTDLIYRTIKYNIILNINEYFILVSELYLFIFHRIVYVSMDH